LLLTTTATHRPHPLSLHDALPISGPEDRRHLPGHQAADQEDHEGHPFIRVAHGPVTHGVDEVPVDGQEGEQRGDDRRYPPGEYRSEEHTSELQSRGHLVCRLLLEK